jgi:2-polyprenyl-3-methyl-5-hydroxy-6-metoxy-1,4-benzoquinol methylase
MSVNIPGNLQEDGIVVGNAFDKYHSSNPLVQWFMRGFEAALDHCVQRSSPASIHEVGCGEGYWVVRWLSRGIEARGSDFSDLVIDLARRNALQAGLSGGVFSAKSIYDLQPGADGAELIVCCEVLEHLEHPRRALEALQRVVTGHLVVSVPREPLWRLLNLARGKYIREFGNTPGHVQHWSSRAFRRLVGEYFDVIEMMRPMPWTMLLCRPRPH